MPNVATGGASFTPTVAPAPSSKPTTSQSNTPVATKDYTVTTQNTQTGGQNPSIQPDPGTLAREKATALQAYNTAVSNIGTRRSATLAKYGMTATVNPDGTMGTSSIDINNPLGAFQQLYDTQAGDDQAALQQSADRGIGSIGLGAQGLAAAALAHASQKNDLGQQYLGETGTEDSDLLTAGNTLNAGYNQAWNDAVAAAISNGDFTTAPQTPQATSTTPTTTKTSTAAKPSNAAALAKVATANYKKAVASAAKTRLPYLGRH